ncbi:hypothetical protein LTR84_007313 [Exophiala bonariae]|uniref:Uncharacterized protein n=1 Tax=Exophiala bonariae TaxID=1690606 RepID=A0AAV9N2A8_9EURO|nr:hypothetical protein LTR84_007313 [Exophiala bonariae]
MGVMDLPRFVVGRKTPILHVWKQSHADSRPPAIRNDGIETATGLPRSLIQLLAEFDSENTENSLWMWCDAEGDTTQWLLWNMYRLAGILSMRSKQRTSNSNPVEQPAPALKSLISQSIAHIDGYSVLTQRAGVEDPSALLFPLFSVGSHASALTVAQKTFISDTLHTLKRHHTSTVQAQGLLQVLNYLWQHPLLNADEVAQHLSLEISLL